MKNKFYLNVSDGFHYYHHDLRKEQQHLSRRSMRDSGIMIWGDVDYQGKMEIKVIIGKLNGKKSVETIDEQINTYA